MTDDHPGSKDCYQHKGCRLPQCRAANTLAMNKYRRKRAHNGAQILEQGIVGGHLMAEADPVRKQLHRLHTRLSWRRISQLSGVKQGAIETIIYRQKRGRVYSATAQAVDSLYEDYFGEVWVEKDDRRYPVEPLIEVINRRYDSDLGAGDVWRKRIQRGKERGFSAKNAEQAAVDLDMVPEEIWPDYGRAS